MVLHVNVKEYADHLGISTKTAYKWCRSGKVEDTGYRAWRRTNGRFVIEPLNGECDGRCLPAAHDSCLLDAVLRAAAERGLRLDFTQVNGHHD